MEEKRRGGTKVCSVQGWDVGAWQGGVMLFIGGTLDLFSYLLAFSLLFFVSCCRHHEENFMIERMIGCSAFSGGESFLSLFLLPYFRSTTWASCMYNRLCGNTYSERLFPLLLRS